MKSQAKFYRPVQESLAHSRRLARAFAIRAFADCTKKKRCRLRFRPNCLYQFENAWPIRAVSPEPSLVALTKKGCRRRLRPNFIGHFKKVWHVHAVSPEPSLVALKKNGM